jgi:tetratricopeptide (TPR) repeat protein
MKTQTPIPPQPKPIKKGRTDRRAAKRNIASTPQPESSGRSRASGARASAAHPIGAQRRLRADRLYEKALQYHRRHHLERAIGLYREVIKIDPEHKNARFNLGAAYLQTDAFSKAYVIMADLYMKEPDNLQVMLNLAVAHIGCRRFNEALALLDKAAACPEPPLFEIALHKGIAYRRLNRPREALNWYKRAEALRPDDPHLLFNLAVVSDQQQHYAAAIDYYRRYIDLSPDMDAAKTKEIRRRIRILQAYHARRSNRESIAQ